MQRDESLRIMADHKRSQRNLQLGGGCRHTTHHQSLGNALSGRMGSRAEVGVLPGSRLLAWRGRTPLHSVAERLLLHS